MAVTVTLYITGRGRILAPVLGYGNTNAPGVVARRSGNCLGLHITEEA
jgi:hypothetical protein